MCPGLDNCRVPFDPEPSVPGALGHQTRTRIRLALLGLGLVMYLSIKLGRVDPVGLAIGLSTVVFSIISFGISQAVKIRAGETI